jgi:hypothetical protein
MNVYRYISIFYVFFNVKYRYLTVNVHSERLYRSLTERLSRNENGNGNTAINFKMAALTVFVALASAFPNDICSTYGDCPVPDGCLITYNLGWVFQCVSNVLDCKEQAAPTEGCFWDGQLYGG